MLKCNDILTRFQIYFRNDLNECNVSTITNLIHQRKRDIKIIRTTSLFNVIRTIIDRKKRFVYCTVERLLHLSKHELTLNEEFASKVKRARKIMSERRNEEQSVNKDTSLSVSIKYLSIINRRGADFKIRLTSINTHCSHLCKVIVRQKKITEVRFRICKI